MENRQTNIKERILQIAKYKKISYEAFFEELNMSYGNFKGKAKKTPLNSDAIASILTKYNDISADWLLLGTGNMRKDNNVQHTQSPICDNPWNFNKNNTETPLPNCSNNLGREIEKLKVLICEKDTQLSLKDEIIKSKDEIIKLLKEKV